MKKFPRFWLANSSEISSARLIKNQWVQAGLFIELSDSSRPYLRLCKTYIQDQSQRDTDHRSSNGHQDICAEMASLSCTCC